MKRFKVLAVAVIGIAVCSAFKNESKALGALPVYQGWIKLEDGNCWLLGLDSGPAGCDRMFTGPVCRATGYPTIPAYAEAAQCEEDYTPSLLKKHL